MVKVLTALRNAKPRLLDRWIVTQSADYVSRVCVCVCYCRWDVKVVQPRGYLQFQKNKVITDL